MDNISEQQALKELEKGYGNAQNILISQDKFDVFMMRLEDKLRTIPVAGGVLGDVSVLVSLVKSYVNKEYADIPLGSIIAAISALAYLLSPIDLIPDFIPGLGLLDDAAVIAACWQLIKSDVDEYLQWRALQRR